MTVPVVPCKLPGCPKPARNGGNGWCNTHYSRWYRTGSVFLKDAAHKPVRYPKGSPLERLGFPCPRCGAKTEVAETRAIPSGTVRRRRVCASEACAAITFTVEVAVEPHRRGRGEK